MSAHISTNKVGVVVLGAGDGKRMKSTVPKVLTLLDGQPLIEHVISHIEAAGCCDRPVVVVSAKHNKVQDYLGDRAVYALQTEQLGTGHALATAEKFLSGKVEYVVVMCGDSPFITGQSLRDLIEVHKKSNSVLTMSTATTPDFQDWRAAFQAVGRIVRSQSGQVTRIVEMKDATKQELMIREINPGFYCFQSDWLWPHLQQLQNNNAQKEYLLTDLVALAIAEGHEVVTVTLPLREVVGVNSPEDLRAVEELKELRSDM